MGTSGSCPCAYAATRPDEETLGSNRTPRKPGTGVSEKNRKWKEIAQYRTSVTTLPVDLLIDFGLDPFDFTCENMCTFYLQMIQFLGLQESFGLQSQTIKSYADNILAQYKDVPYHNSCHAFSITQFLFTVYIKTESIQQSLSKEDALAIFVAALAHDANHPGNNNAWEVATKSPLAVKYNDIAVLENHHCAIGAQTMEKPNCNMFGTLKASKKDEVSTTFVHAILQTDMAQHFKMVDDLKARSAASKEKDARAFEFESLDDRRAVAGVLLHSVDISNPLLPEFDLCERWAKRINEEFINQYRAEGERGIPQTKMWENLDNDLGFRKSQINFVDFVVAPLWVNVIAVFPELQDEGRLRDSLESNRECWVIMKNELEPEAEKKQKKQKKLCT